MTRKSEQVNTVIKHESTNKINLMRVLDDMIVYFPGVYIYVLRKGKVCINPILHFQHPTVE